MLHWDDLTSILEDQGQRLQSYYQDALIATVSHEQMNPLNSIINMSESLYNKCKD